MYFNQNKISLQPIKYVRAWTFCLAYKDKGQCYLERRKYDKAVAPALSYCIV